MVSGGSLFRHILVKRGFKGRRIGQGYKLTEMNGKCKARGSLESLGIEKNMSLVVLSHGCFDRTRENGNGIGFRD